MAFIQFVNTRVIANAPPSRQKRLELEMVEEMDVVSDKGEGGDGDKGAGSGGGKVVDGSDKGKKDGGGKAKFLSFSV